jgi:hypothetical protein
VARPSYPQGVRKPLPGDFLLRPAPVVAGLLLALNDHELKGRFGDTMTGKLSDAAGLVFVPLLTLAFVELARSARRVWWPFTARDLTVAICAVGGALAAAKLSVPVAHAFGDLGGLLRYPFLGHYKRVFITHDPTDLWTLPVLTVAWVQGRVVISSRQSALRPRPCRQTSSFADQI